MKLYSYFIQTKSDIAVPSSNPVGRWIEAMTEFEALQIYFESLEPLFMAAEEHFEYLINEMPEVTKTVELKLEEDHYTENVYANKHYPIV